MVMRTAAFLLTLVLSGGSAVSSAAQGRHQHAGSDPERLGRVMFENSCAPAVQEQIGRAVAMLHSFWYEEVDRRFREIAAADPGCAIAWWGVAMAHWQPLWEVRGPGRDALRRGREALERGKPAARATVRERDYIASLEKFFRGFEMVDHTDRVLAYERAMEALHARYPHDSEAAVFYALALLGSAASLPPDKTYARQKKAGEILQPIFRAQPEHPGVAHYIIHAYDYPALADGALDAARRYARIAADSPHALHMPSHIFTRLGLWDESIASNRKVVVAARKHGIPGEALHGSDYLVFAHLQRGEDAQARRVIEEAPRLAEVPTEATLYFAGLYATATMPARYAVERRAWAEAAALPDPVGFPGGRYAWADASTHFARALGAARTGDTSLARREVEALRTAHRTLVEHREDYWAGQVDVQQRVAEAWLAFAEGRDEALDLMQSAADLEQRADKHPVTPGQIVPARVLLGQMLLELNRPKEALVQFSKVIDAEPNRFTALYGAARAAELAGQTEQAREWYAVLVKIAPQSGRPEVKRAREIVTPSSPSGSG